MQNFDLLREVGATDRPVVLKRGMASTVEEWCLAAEYIAHGGNEKIILCERGIRSFEPATRGTLDVAAIALAKRWTRLPVIVDPSHAAGRRELVLPLALAGIGAGADGVIIETHPNPDEALSDGPQAIRLDAFADVAESMFALARALGRPRA